VYHHVAHRLKRHEAWWSATGTDHLVRLLAARANGTLDTALARVRPWIRYVLRELLRTAS
jgi:hypothetical protein